MTGRKRPKSVRKARAAALARQERAYSSAPHSFIFSRPGVGNFVKQLALDIRTVFEPYTASRLKANRRNVLKDFVTIAGPLHVTHLLYLTHVHKEKRLSKRLRYNSKHDMDPNHNTASSTEPDSKPDSHSILGSSNNADGGVYLHLLRVPHGPSLTFAVVDYSLQRDVLSLVRRIFDSHQFTTPPLLVMTGFGSSGDKHKTGPPPPHLRLVVDMFQNMLPSLNVQKLKLSSVRRVLLISRDVDASATDDAKADDLIYIRHYNVRTENRSVSRALRRLRLGGTSSKRRSSALVGSSSSTVVHGLGPGGSGKSSGVPNLGKYTCIEDFLTKSSMLSDSCPSDALSDLEEVQLPETKLTLNGGTNGKYKSSRRALRPSHGLHHLGMAKTATVRLTEIGPRLTLRLIKIEEGLNTGAVLYHRWHTRTLAEMAVQSERLLQREALRAQRRAEHEAKRAAKEAEREAHRAACLEGMRRRGQLPVDPKPEAIQTPNIEEQISTPQPQSKGRKRSLPPSPSPKIKNKKRKKG